MENAMRKLILTTAAALTIAAIPAIAGAQQTDDTTTSGSAAASGSVQAGDPSADVNGSASVDASGSANTAASTSWSPNSTTSTTTGAGASVDFQGADAAPAPPASYPLCRGNIQDECINPREAGKNFGNRPLKYWPGQPASTLK
jgi:hypothetical protein